MNQYCVIDQAARGETEVGRVYSVLWSSSYMPPDDLKRLWAQKIQHMEHANTP